MPSRPGPNASSRKLGTWRLSAIGSRPCWQASGASVLVDDGRLRLPPLATRLAGAYHFTEGACMRLVNRSRYPTPEVRALVDFGLQDIDHRHVLVFVANSGHPCWGGT